MHRQQIIKNTCNAELPPRMSSSQPQNMHNLQHHPTQKRSPSVSQIQLQQKLQRYLLKDYTFLHDYIIVDTQDSNNCSNNMSNYASSRMDLEGVEVFVAQIMGTDQLVKFNKIPYHQSLLPRFQVLVQLYEQGVVLADNLFILDQGGKLFFYIIQAYIPDNHHIQNNKQYPSATTKRNNNNINDQHSGKTFSNTNNISLLSAIPATSSRFITLKQLINSPSYSQDDCQKSVRMIDKLKILVDCVHQIGQAYIGLTPTHIIIDLQDQQSMYLAPYILNPQVPGTLNSTYRQQNSYLSPQMLQIQHHQQQNRNKPSRQKQIKISNEMLIKNDIWAFGCIVLEILFYCSPVFMAVSDTNQNILINQFMTGQSSSANQQQQYCINWCINKLDNYCEQSYSFTTSQSPQTNRNTMLKNLILNTLQLQPSKRLLTSLRTTPITNRQEHNKTKTKMKKVMKNQQINGNINYNNTTTCRQEQPLTNRNQTELSSPIHAIRTNNTIQNWSITPLRDNTNMQPQTNPISIPQQLNNTSTKTETELHLTFLYISNIQINKQLRINVFLDRKYSIFVSPNCHNCKITKINKTITMQATYHNMDAILQNPILIQIKYKQNTQPQQHITININLSTLVLVDSGRRVWDKPLIGSYYVNGTYGIDQPSIKIKAQLVNICKHKSMNESMKIKQNKILLNDKQLRKTIQQRKKYYEQIRQVRQQQKQRNKQKQIQKICTQNKQNQDRKQENKDKKGTILQFNNYFMDINKNLQQICQKWKFNTYPYSTNKQYKNKSISIEDSSISNSAQNNRQQLQIPASLQPSNQVSQYKPHLNTNIQNKKQDIDTKIKAILGKLNIFRHI